MFKSFVLFAEMRTGSNFLEENINQFSDLQSYGELFNPHFVGFANKKALCGVSMAQREADPEVMLKAIRTATPGALPGFRFFHDHDARVLDRVLSDRRCAKVVLTRNPLDSYVSRRIAAETGQWKLTDMKHQKAARIRFDGAEFERHIDVIQRFQLRLLAALQTSGQTAFYIGYDDINDLDVLNGLARFLGSEHQVAALKTTLKKQNPSPITSKVTNPKEMQRVLSGLDRFDLSRTPNFEPRRGAGVPGFHAGAKAPFLFMPVRGAPTAPVLDWMAHHDAAAGAKRGEALVSGFNQKTLRQWKRQHPGHVSFTVLRHPLARAHESFCRHILSTGEESYGDIRETLRSHYKLPIPASGPGEGYDASAHRAAFMGFLAFLKGNLSAQTGIRVDASWASQSAIVQGMAQVAPPDHILREDTLAAALAAIEAQTGSPHVALGGADYAPPFGLTEICDEAMQQAARDAYARDYMMFGFSDWAG